MDQRPLASESTQVSHQRARAGRGVFIALILAIGTFGSSEVLAQPKKPAAPRADAQVDSKDPAPGDSPDDYSLAVGETRTLPAKDLKHYKPGAPGIFEAKQTPDGSKLILSGRKVGTSTLLLIYQDGSQSTYTVNVWARPPQVVEKEVSQMLESIPGVRRRRVGGRIILDGQVPTENDAKRVQQIAAIYGGQVESIVTFPPPPVGPGATTTPLGDAEDEDGILIRVDFYFVQYDKRTSYGVGVAWPDAIGATAQGNAVFDLAGGSLSSATATLSSQPLPSLDIASRHGWAKVLKHATVVTQNAIEAHFQSGGEQIFSVTTGLSSTLQKVPFGAEVTVLPRFKIERGTLDLRVMADVSDLTSPGQGTIIPSRLTSQLTTNVRLRLGQALILSGFRTKSINHNVSGLPLLSDLPILGVFFGAHTDASIETEGAIFIVPSVVTTVPKPAAEMVDAALQSFTDYSGEIEEVHAFPRTPPSAIPVSRGTGKQDHADRKK